MKSLLPLLALFSASTAWAAPWSEAAAELATDPANVANRYALAAALLDANGMEEEAAASLAEFLDSERYGDEAATLLGRLLAREAPRPGWSALYDRVAAKVKDPVMAAALQRIDAEAERASFDEAGKGRSTLIAQAKAAPNDPAKVMRAADAHLEGADAGEALALLRNLSARREARERLILATFDADQQSLDLAWWKSLLGEAGFETSALHARVGDVAPGEEAAAISALRQIYLDEIVDTEAQRVLPAVDTAALQAAIATPSALNRGQALLGAGYPLAAIDVLEQDVPEDAPPEEAAAAAVLLGQAQASQSAPKQALAAFQEALTFAPGLPAARVGGAKALADLGRYNDALDLLGGLEPGLQRTIAARMAADKAAKMSNSAARGDALSAAYLQAPDDVEIARAYGVWLAKNDQPAGALEPLAVVLAADPGDGEALGAYVDAAMNTNQPALALDAAHAGLPEVGNVSAHDGLAEAMAWSWVKLGEQRKSASDIDGALDAFLVAHAMLPDEAAVLRGLGGALWTANRKDEAYAAFREAYRLEPSNADALRAIVELALVTDRDAEARALIDRHRNLPSVAAIEKRLDLRLELDRAAADLEAGNRASALGRYERLLATNPGDADVLRGVGGAWLAQGDAERALTYYREASAADPNNRWSDLGIANAYLSLGELDTAEALLDMLDKEPDAALKAAAADARATLWRERAAAAQRAGNVGAAFRNYERALKLDGSVYSYTGLGNLYRDSGQHDLAADMYRAALAEDPTYAPARAALVGLLTDAGLLDAAADVAKEVDGTPLGEELAEEVRIGRELERARVARELGDLDEARRLVQRTRERYPEADAPVRAWRQLELEYGSPEQIFERAQVWLADDPEDIGALRSLLGSSHKLERTEEVLPVFLTAAEGGDPELESLYATARLAADLEAARALSRRGQRGAAADKVDILEGRALDQPDRWALVGGTWLALDDMDQAISAYDAALTLDPDFAPALVGKAVALREKGKAGSATQLLEAQWDETGNPDVGLALAEMYLQRGQARRAQDVLDAMSPEAAARAGSRGELPALDVGMDSGEDLSLSRDAALSPDQAERRRALTEGVAGAALPGIEAGMGYHARPGASGRQFLNAVFFPVRVHDLSLGPVSFDVEAVPVLLTDAEHNDAGARLTGGVSAGLGPVGLTFRGGVSEIGFEAKPYFIWYGGVSVRPTQSLMLGVHTGRDPVTDSFTSWAGVPDAAGIVFGRVSRLWIGGYLSVDPTPLDNIALAARGGWNQGYQMEANPFWEVSGQATHTLDFGRGALELGGELLTMSFRDQQDVFRAGEGGYFSPDLFVYAGFTAEGGIHTKDERFYACLGGGVGPQLIRAEDLDEDEQHYIGSGVFAGGTARAALDWRVARYWRLGVDYNFQATGAFWQAHTAMMHVHFGPSDTWARRSQPSFSPLAGAPVQQGQGCSL